MFGYEYQESYSHGLFAFFLIGIIVALFFLVAFVMTMYSQNNSFALSGQLLG